MLHESESPLAQQGHEHAYMIVNTLNDMLKIPDTARSEVSAQYALSIIQICSHKGTKKHLLKHKHHKICLQTTLIGELMLVFL